MIQIGDIRLALEPGLLTEPGVHWANQTSSATAVPENMQKAARELRAAALLQQRLADAPGGVRRWCRSAVGTIELSEGEADQGSALIVAVSEAPQGARPLAAVIEDVRALADEERDSGLAKLSWSVATGILRALIEIHELSSQHGELEHEQAVRDRILALPRGDGYFEILLQYPSGRLAARAALGQPAQILAKEHGDANRLAELLRWMLAGRDQAEDGGAIEEARLRSLFGEGSGAWSTFLVQATQNPIHPDAGFLRTLLERVESAKPIAQESEPAPALVEQVSEQTKVVARHPHFRLGAVAAAAIAIVGVVTLMIVRSGEPGNDTVGPVNPPDTLQFDVRLLSPSKADDGSTTIRVKVSGVGAAALPPATIYLEVADAPYEMRQEPSQDSHDAEVRVYACKIAGQSGRQPAQVRVGDPGQTYSIGDIEFPNPRPENPDPPEAPVLALKCPESVEEGGDIILDTSGSSGIQAPKLKLRARSKSDDTMELSSLPQDLEPDRDSAKAKVKAPAWFENYEIEVTLEGGEESKNCTISVNAINDDPVIDITILRGEKALVQWPGSDGKLIAVEPNESLAIRVNITDSDTEVGQPTLRIGEDLTVDWNHDDSARREGTFTGTFTGTFKVPGDPGKHWLELVSADKTVTVKAIELDVLSPSPTKPSPTEPSLVLSGKKVTFNLVPNETVWLSERIDARQLDPKIDPKSADAEIPLADVERMLGELKGKLPDFEVALPSVDEVKRWKLVKPAGAKLIATRVIATQTMWEANSDGRTETHINIRKELGNVKEPFGSYSDWRDPKPEVDQQAIFVQMPDSSIGIVGCPRERPDGKRGDIGTESITDLAVELELQDTSVDKWIGPWPQPRPDRHFPEKAYIRIVVKPRRKE